MIPGWTNFPKEANTGHITCCLWTVVSIAQLPRLPSIVTHFQVITKVCEDVNEVVQLIHLLSWDVTCTIDQLEKSRTNKPGGKKQKPLETRRRNLRFLCLCRCRQSAGHLCLVRSVSWCNLAKSYIFGFLLDWRARWYETVVTNIFSWDGKFSPSFFPGVNFRRTGEFHLKIILITVRTHSRRKIFNCAKITKVMQESYKVSL